MALLPKRAGANTKSNSRLNGSSEQQQHSYRSVEIIPHSSGRCAAVDSLAGYRILADEAPSLPLPDCDYAECKCRYAPYKDRRAGLRRDADVGIAGMASMLRDDSGRSDAPGRRTEDKGKN